MISNLRISVIELAVWALLAAAGLTWLMLLARDGLERVWEWWQDRRLSPAMAARIDIPACDWEAPDGKHCWRDAGHDGPHWFTEEEFPPLPPERTWEQMTSHQLPLVDGTRGLDSAGVVREREPWRVEAPTGPLSVNRERRAPWWEAEHRAAYESLGFDYPSGLMARVREMAP